MKRLYVFSVLLFLLVPVQPVSSDVVEKTTVSNDVKVGVGFENMSTASRSIDMTVPSSMVSSNDVFVEVGRRDGVNFVVMQGETESKKLMLSLPSQKLNVELEKRDFTLNESFVSVEPKAFELGPDGKVVEFQVELPEMEPGEYRGYVDIKHGDERVGTVKVKVEVLEKVIEPLNFHEPEIQEGGIFYRWYRTYPGSEIRTGSELIEISQPDRRGIFSLRVNSSEVLKSLGIGVPALVNFSFDGVVVKNGAVERFNQGLGFALNITKRRYSTRWSAERKGERGVGVVASLEEERKRKFTVEYDTGNSLELRNDRKYGAGGGAGASLFSAELGPVEGTVLGGGASGMLAELRGNSEGINYEESGEKGKVEAAIHMLGGLSPELKPFGGMLLGKFLKDPRYLHENYEYSGLGMETEGGVNLVDIGLSPGDGVESDVAKIQVGGSGSKSGSYIYKNHARGGESYIFGTEEAYSLGMTGGILGNDPLDLTGGQEVRSELTFRNSSDGDVRGELSLLSGKRSVVYSLKDARKTEMYREVLGAGQENRLVLSSLAWMKDFRDLGLDNKKIKKTVLGYPGGDIGLEVPLSFEVLGVKLSMTEGVKFSRSNVLVKSEYQLSGGRELPLEVYPNTKSEPLKSLKGILTYSLEPLLESRDKFSILKKSLENGRLTFPSGSLSTQDGRGEFLITTYDPSDYHVGEISSDYRVSLSGSGFAIGNVTEITQINGSEVDGKITLDYNGTGEMYRWNGTEDVWDPVNTSPEDGNMSSEFKEGTYVIGQDVTPPSIKGNVSELFRDGVRLSLEVKDNGTGIRRSSVKVLVDGEPANFSYDRVSGILEVEEDVEPGNYSLSVVVEDTSGNSNSIEKKVEVVDVPEVKSLDVIPVDGQLKLNWTSGGKADYFMVLKDGKVVNNTTETYHFSDGVGSSAFAVIPGNGNGFGEARSSQFIMPRVVPEFTVDWERGLRPEAGAPITFNASPTWTTNGSIDAEIKNYRWIFLNESGDRTGNGSGVLVNFSFPEEGRYTAVLNVTDERGRHRTTNRSLYVEEARETSVDISIRSRRNKLSGPPGSNLVYEVVLKNEGLDKDIVSLAYVNCKWPWKLIHEGKEVEVPYPGENYSSHLLSPAENETLELVVEAPESGPSGVEVKVKVESMADPTVNESLSLYGYVGEGERGEVEAGGAGGGGGGGGGLPTGKMLEDEGDVTKESPDRVGDPENKTRNETEVDTENETETNKTASETPTGRFLDPLNPLAISAIAAVLVLLVVIYIKI